MKKENEKSLFVLFLSLDFLYMNYELKEIISFIRNS